MGIQKVGLERHPRMTPKDICLALTWGDGGIDYIAYDDMNFAVKQALAKARSAGLEKVEVDVSVLENLLKTSV